MFKHLPVPSSLVSCQLPSPKYTHTHTDSRTHTYIFCFVSPCHRRGVPPKQYRVRAYNFEYNNVLVGTWLLCICRNEFFFSYSVGPTLHIFFLYTIHHLRCCFFLYRAFCLYHFYDGFPSVFRMYGTFKCDFNFGNYCVSVWLLRRWLVNKIHNDVLCHK